MPKNPFRYFKTSPAIIQLAVLMYVRFPLSLRNIEDLLHERGVDVCHESVRLEQVSKPVQWRDQELGVGASVGIAFPSSAGARVFSALEEADAALYAAKQNGKGCVVLARELSHKAATDAIAA